MIGSPQWFPPVLQLAVSKAKKVKYFSKAVEEREVFATYIKVGIVFDFVSIILTTNVVLGS